MKKIFSFTLAVALAAASLVSFASCDPGNEPPKDPVNGTEWDEAKTQQLTAALAAADFDCFVMTGVANVDATEEGISLFKNQIDLELSVDGMNEDLQLSVLMQEEGEEANSGYTVAYRRMDNVYYDAGLWGDVLLAAGDFDGLLSAYRSGDAVLQLLDVSSIFGQVGGMTPSTGLETQFLQLLSDPAALKLMKNLPALIEAEGSATEDGYELRYDLVEAFRTLLSRVEETLSAVTDQTTLSQLAVAPFVVEMLDSLFDGVKAADLLALVPEEYSGILEAFPAAGDMTVAQYVVACLGSETLFAALPDHPVEYRTLGDLPIGMLIGEGTLDKIKSAVTELKTDPIAFFFSLSGLAVRNSDLTLDVVYGFNADMELVSFSTSVRMDVTAPASVYDPTLIELKADASFTAAMTTDVVLRDLKGVHYNDGAVS